MAMLHNSIDASFERGMYAYGLCGIDCVTVR
jgi:hypothetical protein